jgi:hypothetical protein
MNKAFRYILAFSTIILILSSCEPRVRVIPRDKLAEIYADMYASDQWVASNPGERDLAETSWIYEPIFKKYGYTLEDYQKSVRYYLQDPEKYAKILTNTSKILKRHADELRTAERKLQMMRMSPDNFHTLTPLYQINVKNDVGPSGIEVAIDSTTGYRKVSAVISDTTFRGPKLLIKADEISIQSGDIQPIGVPKSFVKRPLFRNKQVIDANVK